MSSPEKDLKKEKVKVNESKKDGSKRRVSPDQCPHRSVVTTLPRRDELSQTEFARIIVPPKSQGRHTWQYDPTRKKAEIDQKRSRLDPVEEEPLEQHSKTIHIWKVPRASIKTDKSLSVHLLTSAEKNECFSSRSETCSTDPNSGERTETLVSSSDYTDSSQTTAKKSVVQSQEESREIFSLPQNQVPLKSHPAPNEIIIFEEEKPPTEFKIRAQETSEIQIKQLKKPMSTFLPMNNEDDCFIDIDNTRDMENQTLEAEESREYIIKSKVRSKEIISDNRFEDSYRQRSENNEGKNNLITDIKPKIKRTDKSQDISIKIHDKKAGAVPKYIKVEGDLIQKSITSGSLQAKSLPDIVRNVIEEGESSLDLGYPSDIPSAQDILRSTNKNAVELSFLEKKHIDICETQSDYYLSNSLEQKSRINSGSTRINPSSSPLHIKKVTSLNNEATKISCGTKNTSKLLGPNETNQSIKIENDVNSQTLSNRENELKMLNETINSVIGASYKDYSYPSTDYAVLQAQPVCSSKVNLPEKSNTVMRKDCVQEDVKDILYTLISDKVLKDNLFVNKQRTSQSNLDANTKKEISSGKFQKVQTKMDSKVKLKKGKMNNSVVEDEKSDLKPIVSLEEVKSKEESRKGHGNTNPSPNSSESSFSGLEYSVYNTSITSDDAKARGSQDPWENPEVKLTLKSHGFIRAKKPKKQSVPGSEESTENFIRVTDEPETSKYILKNKNLSPDEGSSSRNNSDERRTQTSSSDGACGPLRSLLQSTWFGFKSKKESIPEKQTSEINTGFRESCSSQSIKSKNKDAIIKKPVISSESIFPQTESKLPPLKLQVSEEDRRTLIDSRELAKEILFLLKIILLANDYVITRNPRRRLSVQRHRSDSDVEMVTPEDSDLDTVT